MTPNREQKVRILGNSGFSAREVREILRTTRILSNGKRIRVAPLPLDVPYVKEIIRQRARNYRRALSSGMTRGQYIHSITETVYPDFLDENGNPDFWKYLRYIENKYKDEHPEYNSPQGKAHKRQSKDFVSKYKRGANLRDYAKYRGKE